MDATRRTQLQRSRRRPRDDGAVLVEFALVAPLLFLLIFAIIDFGWVFGQHLDVRHGAREGARLAAVDYAADEADPTAAIVAEVCERMDANPDVHVALDRDADATIGDRLTVTVTRPAVTLTRFVDFALADIELSSTVTGRIEIEPTWDPTPEAGVPCQ
jgi:Flp pilus assembly protein TadG